MVLGSGQPVTFQTDPQDIILSKLYQKFV